MRFTTDKPVKEMTMLELAHNCCYIGPDKNARYRDYDRDRDIRQVAVSLLETYTDTPYDFTGKYDFDEFIAECLQYGTESMEGVIATMYMLMWSMAELREKLKKYEDNP